MPNDRLLTAEWTDINDKTSSIAEARIQHSAFVHSVFLKLGPEGFEPSPTRVRAGYAADNTSIPTEQMLHD